MNHREIAIVGASGPTGRVLVRSLCRAGRKVRAIVRDRGQRGNFPPGVKVVSANLEDRDTLGPALEGARSVYYIPPRFCDREESYAAALIGEMDRCGVGHLVYHSVLHAPTPAMPHHARKAAVEGLIRDSQLEWTILQPAMYGTTPLAFFDAESGRLAPAFDPAQVFSPIDPDDLAEAAARVLTEDGHLYATYELAGAEMLSFADMAAMLATILGKPVTADRAETGPVVARMTRDFGFTATQAKDLEAMLLFYDAHGLRGNGKILAMLLGRQSTGFTDTASRALASRS